MDAEKEGSGPVDRRRELLEPASGEPVDVTVVLPCYNAADFVENAVVRLLEQVHVALEVVIVDDASSDDTPAIVERLTEHPQVRAILLPVNEGVAAAREKAVAAALGQYVWFVDDDDDWPDDAVSALHEAAISTNADIVCAGATVVGEGRTERAVGNLPPVGVLNREHAFSHFLRGDITGHLWNKLFRRSVLERIEFTRIRQHSDQAMVSQAIVESERIAVLDRSVYRYQLRSGSIIRSGARRGDSLRQLDRVVRRSAERLGESTLRGPDYLYYRARYNLLSRLKDATSGAYSDYEKKRLIREIRREMSLSQLLAIARRRDATRLALFSVGWAAPGVYRVALDRGGGRA